MKYNALKIIILLVSASTRITAGGFSAADALRSDIARCLGLTSFKDGSTTPKPGVIHSAEPVFNDRVVAALLKIDNIHAFIQTLNELIKSKARGLDVTAEDLIQGRLLELAGGYQAPYAATLQQLHQLLTIDEQAASAPDEQQPVKAVDFSLVVSNTLKDGDYAYVSSISPVTTRMDIGSRQHYFNWYMSNPQSPLFDKDIYCFQEWDGQLGDALKRAGYEWIENLTTGLVIAFKNSKFKKIASSGDAFKGLPLAGGGTFSSSGHFGYLVAFLESKQDANLKLGILNTHLQSRPTDPAGAKEAMIKKLVGLVETAGRLAPNWIICGDFNINGLDRSAGSQFTTLLNNPLAQHGFTNIVPSQTTSFAKPTRASQTDYAFLKGNLIHKGIMFIPQDVNQLLKYAADGSDARTTFFSDHAAIVADLSLQ